VCLSELCVRDLCVCEGVVCERAVCERGGRTRREEEEEEERTGVHNQNKNPTRRFREIAKTCHRSAPQSFLTTHQ